jgi:hypothetical protein
MKKRNFVSPKSDSHSPAGGAGHPNLTPHLALVCIGVCGPFGFPFQIPVEMHERLLH